MHNSVLGGYSDAAAYLGIPETLVRRRVAQRQLRALRMGHRTVKFRRVDLDAYLDKCATGPAGGAQ